MLEAIHQHLLDLRKTADGRRLLVAPGEQARSNKPRRPAGMSGRQWKLRRKALQRESRWFTRWEQDLWRLAKSGNIITAGR